MREGVRNRPHDEGEAHRDHTGRACAWLVQAEEASARNVCRRDGRMGGDVARVHIEVGVVWTSDTSAVVDVRCCTVDLPADFYPLRSLSRNLSVYGSGDDADAAKGHMRSMVCFCLHWSS